MTDLDLREKLARIDVALAERDRDRKQLRGRHDTRRQLSIIVAAVESARRASITDIRLKSAHSSQMKHLAAAQTEFAAPSLGIAVPAPRAILGQS